MGVRARAETHRRERREVDDEGELGWAGPCGLEPSHGKSYYFFIFFSVFYFSHCFVFYFTIT